MTIGKEEAFVFHWKIKELRYSTLRNGECIFSPSFMLPNFKDTTWRLKLYPKGDGLGSTGFISAFLCRMVDKGPDKIHVSVNIKTNVKTHNFSFEKKFLMDSGFGYNKFLRTSEIQSGDPFIILCELRCLDSNHPHKLVNVKRLLPSSLENPSDYALSALNELDSQNCEKGRKLFQYPCKSFSQTLFCCEKCFVQMPLDASLVTGKKQNQIIPVISTTKFPPLLVKVIRSDETDKHLKLLITLLNGKIEKSLLLTCQISVWIDGIEVIYLPREDYLFHSKEIDELWTLKKTIDVPNLSLNLADALSNSTLWKMDFTFYDGQVHSEILWTEIAGDVDSAVSCSVSIFLNQILRLYKEKKFCDVTLKVGNKTYDVHKAILAAMSPVFSAMFDSHMAEKATSTVDIVDLDEDIVRTLVDFMYSGTIEILQFEDAQVVFAAADKYQIVPLMNLCRKRLMEAISFEDVCEILSLSDRHTDLELKEACIKFIGFCEKVILDSEEWKILEEENMTLANEVLNEICVCRK